MHTSTIYLNEPQALYAKALAEKCPPGLDRIFLMNSGTEVNNTAVMLMRLFTRQNKVYSLRHCYHGNLTPLTAIGYWISPTEKGPGFERMAFPGTYQANYEGANKAEFYAQELKELIQDTSHGFIAGFIAEPVMGAAGVYTLPEGFLKKAFEVVRAHKGLCVADEVQTGFGRLGSSFWGSVDQHALPDMITMAKSIGNGYPLAALATTQEISDALSKSQFFSTYGADPIACTAGLENLRIIEEEGLQENARARGEQLLAGLARIMGQSHTIGSVRGKGLMLSLEFVKDKETR